MKILTFMLILTTFNPAYEHRWLYVEITGYCPQECCCQGDADGVTATGRSAWKAGVAVDPAIIPLGSHLDIPGGYKRGPNKNGSWIKADDRGGAIKGYKIDIRFNTHWEARKWGRKWRWIRVWRKK